MEGAAWTKLSKDYVLDLGDMVFRLHYGEKDHGWTDYLPHKLISVWFNLQVRKANSVNFSNTGYKFIVGRSQTNNDESVDGHEWDDLEQIGYRAYEIIDALYNITGIRILQSPWGEVEDSDVYLSGHIFKVHTPSHGGIMVSNESAKLFLSATAKRYGVKYKNFYCYEEDCDWAIPVYELKLFWPIIFKDSDKGIKKDPEAYLLKFLTTYNSEYLNELQESKKIDAQ